jgi:uncharacterized SAM-binding protein YcdF (DUF218 family)
VLASIASVWACFNAGTGLVVSRDVGEPEAIVMLASHEFERLPAAVALAHQYPASRILLTVPQEPTRWNCHMCAERAALMESMGIARARIVELPNRARNTYGEALTTRAYLADHPMRRLVVVTSPYHTRRALSTFSHVLKDTGVQLGVLPSTAWSPASPEQWWHHEYDRDYVVYEWAGLLYYRIKYGVPLSSEASGRGKIPIRQ